MPVFAEDPSQLSKSRLKSDLIAHNVALPPAQSKKEIYVELHMKHIDQKNAADFSSDEEDPGQDVVEESAEENPKEARILDPSVLTDDDLKAALLKYGVKAGPIVASTRALYEKKLRTILQSDGHGTQNGADEAVLYSDSEEEEENAEDKNEESDTEDTKQTVEREEEDEQESSQVKLPFQSGSYVYPQCFLPSSRLRARAPIDKEPSRKWNSRNVLKSSQRSRCYCSQIPPGISKASSVDQRSGLAERVISESKSVISIGSSVSSPSFSITQMVEEMETRRSLSSCEDIERELNGSNEQDHWSQSNRLDTPILVKRTVNTQSPFYAPMSFHSGQRKKEPVKDTFKDLFPDTETTPTGIYATCRRPIKGAAGRPIQYAYPTTPLSPTTLERREVERRLVPIYIQMFVFLIVACVLYFIYIYVEDTSFSPLVAFLDSLGQGLEDAEGLLLGDETQDAPAFSEGE